MESIDRALAQVGAVLVEDRLRRRVIKRHRRLPGMGLQVPHAHCYALPRADLEKLVEPGEIAIDPTISSRLVIVAGDRAAVTAGDVPAWRQVWRGIFHARIHQHYDELLADQRLTVAAIRERIHRIGQTEFDEIRYVLTQEDLLLPPVDDASTYVEFVALYLELARFAPAALARTFPALHDPARVEATIALDLDHATLLAACRPTGAPAEPADPIATAVDAAPRAARAPDPEAALDAARARDKGNRARAAILSFRAGNRLAAKADLEALAARLGRALGCEPTGWADGLAPVAEYAAGESVLRFTAGARLLYDLQAACVVAEREVKVIDPAGWALSRGKQPIARPLPATREVRIAKHLHAAGKKITKCGMATAADRERLADAVHAIIARGDDNVRAMLRPKLEAALDEVELKPRQLPERVAQKKIVDELLDHAVAVGRLSLGNLRDAISHNDLKLADLSARQLAQGDQLLRADQLLSRSLDGVYRRGEVYLRFLQKLSSILSATSVGRFLSLYLLLPVIGSFMLVEGLQHVVGPLSHKLFHVEPEIATMPAFVGVGVFLFLLLHVPPVRTASRFALRVLGRVLRTVFVSAPRALWRLSFVQAIAKAKVTRWVILPAIPAAIAWFLFGGVVQWPVALGVFAIVEVVANSRIGRLIEEHVTDYVIRSGRQLTRRILPGLVRYLLEFFTWLIELFNRLIYRIDEWLRFKQGQSTFTMVIKGTIGTIWSVIAYALRVYVNLFVEPTVNPIKHFPVVTVAAKLILPFTPQLISAFNGPATQLLGPTLGGSFAGFTVFVLPGLAGFLVWELNANWKLYRATRATELGAVSIGHHGETMVGFMKPGFHSGTIPKLYAKLRRAAWKGDEKRAARQREGLHHVEEAIWKFADRQLASMLNEAAPFRATDVAIGHVEVGSNRVEIELACPSQGATAAVIAFEHQSGWLVASVPVTGWIDALAADQRAVFLIALAGFYKLSGVDLVREQLEQVLADGAATAPPYDVSDEGLIVWPGTGYDVEVIYDLHAKHPTAVTRGAPWDGHLVPLGDRQARFGRESLTWAMWATTWQELARGHQALPVISGPSLLPPPAAIADAPAA
ncbi:MAG: hypothetical protein K8W52_00370 [Deltaproteobacteria bacterium]|nr:hypothetical protein [Deltaproteobacteria bacterium]